MTDQTATPLSEFLTDLLQEGRAIVRGELHLHAPARADSQRAKELLNSVAVAAAADAPGTPPPFDPSIALWSAEAFAWACGMLIDRSQTDVQLPKRISGRIPKASSASAHWSADVVFRFAGDLIRRSERIGTEDPLYQEFVRLFSPWPLATVGSSIEKRPAALEVVISDVCLRTMLVDRIILQRDTDLAQAEPLARHVEQALGMLEQANV